MRPQSHPINALLNLLGGASMSVMVLWVPYWLNQSIGPNQYALWALANQVLAYIPLLGFGMNQILTRSVASALTQPDQPNFAKYLSTGFWIMLGLMGLSAVIVGLSGLWIDHLLPVETPERAHFQQMWWVLGGAGSVGLLSLYFFGVFGGYQQYLWENAYKSILVFSFVLGLWVLQASDTLTLEHLVWMYGIALGIALLFLIIIYFCKGLPRPHWSNAETGTARQFARGMYGLGIWQFSMVFISGLDLWIVARIEFAAVPGYALALSLMAFLMGVGGALFSPSLPIFANALEETDHARFVVMFRRYQRWLMATSFGITLIIFTLPQTFWINLLGPSSSAFITVMPILLIATVLRLLTLLYAYALIGANRQHQVIASPLLEGIVNVIVSIALGIWLGPIGVALGTLVGAVLCLAMATLYNIPRLHYHVPVRASDLLFPWKTRVRNDPR